MAENTKIQWATHSFSPWIGCAKVHSGCANCYAEAMAGRLGVVWGPNGTRRRTAESTWRQVERWDRQAQKAVDAISAWNHVAASEPALHKPIARPRVFPSLCDPFEDWQGPIYDSAGDVICHQLPPGTGTHRNDPIDMADLRRDFFALIDRTPNLDWMLLTKRPENVRRMWPATPVGYATQREPTAEDYRENVWLLYSAYDQATLDTGLPDLLACRDLVPVLGLSAEPLLGPLNIVATVESWWNTSRAGTCTAECLDLRDWLDWVIVGGESGPNARPCNVEWIRSIVRQCGEAGVPCFVKQLGAKPIASIHEGIGRWKPDICDPKGGDISEWPEDLRVQEYPCVG